MTKNEKITKTFSELGIEIEFVSEKETPKNIIYAYNCKNLKDFTKLKRLIPVLEMNLKEKITLSSSENSHFALIIEREDRCFVNFNDKKHILKNKDNYEFMLGVDENNETLTYNLHDCPHMLISGATGSGKSVFLNSLIQSLKIYSKKLDFVLIDTKRVEFSMYENMSNLLYPVVDDFEDAIEILEKLCEEMDFRYSQLQELGFRNNDDGVFGKIVVIIDELADLMLVSKSKVEPFIVRLAQLGRASGIHLVLATQRPTVNVVTGLIKANIPMRIAFSMASMRDSINILDYKGAESLIGKGDALVKYPNKIQPVRIQGLFLDDEEIQDFVDEFEFIPETQPKKKRKDLTFFQLIKIMATHLYSLIKTIDLYFKKRKQGYSISQSLDFCNEMYLGYYDD